MNRRTPLKRNKPLTAKTQRSHNSTLRSVSPKRSKVKPTIDRERRAYVDAKAGVCESCGGAFERLDCHEISAGASRGRAEKDANTWLAVCRQCHDELQGMPFGYQFNTKIKAVANSINRCLGRTEL